MIPQISQLNPKVNQRQILDPYRTLGSFVSGKITLSQTQPLSFAVPTSDSYKIYSDALAIKVVSPPLSGKVQSVICYNEYSYVKIGTKVIKMKYHHVVRQWNIPQQKIKENTTPTLMKFDTLILISEGKRVYVIDQKQTSGKEVQFYQVKQHIKGMIHPVTYINKVVLFNQTSITLVNPLSQKTLYEYPNLKTYLQQNSLEIVTVESSKLVNIIALSLSNGQILIYNLKIDETVFKVKLKTPAICIAFSDQASLMASSDSSGNVVLWDLQNKKILYKFEEFVEGPINSLVFVPGQSILTCGSSSQNCIKQLRINMQDNRIMTLFRERVGITEAIQKVTLLNNNELILSSKSQSMFTSLYSHTNNYKLNRVLDSSHSFHIISRHFSVQLFKNQTMDKAFNIHESAYIGKISMSQKYYIVATKSRLIKLGVTGVEIKITGIKQIVLFQQHFIFVVTENDLIVLDFATFAPLKEMKIGKCSKSAVNQFGNLLALHNQNTGLIQVYDMEKIQLARQFKLNGKDHPLSFCFSSDNKYLLSSHDKSLLVWSTVHNNLFKKFTLERNIVNMCFTPDNQFLLSVFQGEREINIWNNYIGKILSNRQTQLLKFDVIINRCEEDFRAVLKRNESNPGQKTQEDQQVQTNIGDDILSQIPDSEDRIPEYKFQFAQKWLPLIYYDQIKDRNTIQNPKEMSLPFFLDFKNLDQEKKKIERQIKEDLLNKRKQKQQKIDKHLKNNTNEITLSENSGPQEFKRCIETLETLSIAQIDYQLRAFLLNPANKKSILKMFEYLIGFERESLAISEEFVNIIFHRSLYLIGNQIFDQELKESLSEILNTYKGKVWSQKAKIDKCVAITQKLM